MVTSSPSSYKLSAFSAISFDQVPISRFVVFFNFDSSSASLFSNLLLNSSVSPSLMALLSVFLSDLSVLLSVFSEAVEDVDFSLTNSVELFSSTVFPFFEVCFGGGLITSSSGIVLK